MIYIDICVIQLRVVILPVTEILNYDSNYLVSVGPAIWLIVVLGCYLFMQWFCKFVYVAWLRKCNWLCALQSIRPTQLISFIYLSLLYYLCRFTILYYIILLLCIIILKLKTKFKNSLLTTWVVYDTKYITRNRNKSH